MRIVDIWLDSAKEFRQEFKGLLLATAPMIIGSTLIATINTQVEALPKSIALSIGLIDFLLTWLIFFFATRYLLKRRNETVAENRFAVMQLLLLAILVTLMAALCGLLLPAVAILVAYFSILAPIFILTEKDKAAEAFLSSVGYLLTDFKTSFKALLCLLGALLMFFVISMILMLPLSLALPRSGIPDIISTPLYLSLGLYFDALLLNLYFAIKEYRAQRNTQPPAN